MNPRISAASTGLAFELRFVSLFSRDRALAFPCDALGQVALDELSERARVDYLFARTLIGRDYGAPAVVPSTARLQ